jgi:hypothetical protein
VGFGRDLRGRQLASGTPLLAEVLAGVMMQVPGAFAAYFLPPSGGHARGREGFEGHWGPLCRPVGATTRDEQWTVCRDMIRGGSNGCGRISLALPAPLTSVSTSDCHSENRPAARANRGRPFRRRSARPSRPGRARPGAGKPCILRSTGRGPRRRCRAYRRAGIGFHRFCTERKPAGGMARKSRGRSTNRRYIQCGLG